MIKKICAAVLAAVMLCGAFEVPAYAQAVTAENGAVSQAKDNKDLEENMMKVAAIVKTKLGLGKDLTGFDYYVSTDEDGTDYSFYWTDEDGNISISVFCDDKGRITWYQNNRPYGSVDETKPQYIKRELEDTAMECIAKIAPELKGKIVLKKVETYTWSNSYNYIYDRYENGIKVEDNSVSINLAYDDKSILGFQCTWNYDVKVPSSKGIMSREEAEKLISQKLDMELSYHITYDDKGKLKAFLAYEPSLPYISVNAKTGKIYKKRYYWGEDDEISDEEDMESPKEAANGDERVYDALSDEEIEKIIGVNDLLSKEEAIKLIKNNKKLYMDEVYTSTSARLEKEDDRYVWWISALDERPYPEYDYDEDDENYDPDEYYRGFFDAKLDAKTGRIEFYHSSTKEYYGKKVKKIGKKKCRQVFEAFAKEQDKQKFSKTKFTSSEPSSFYYTEDDKQISYGYYFTYDRYHKKIPVGNDSITGEVDAVTGKINLYDVSFTDVKLPSPANVIGEKKAKKAYLSYEGFDLGYEFYAVTRQVGKGKKSRYVTDEKLRLTYATRTYPELVDANTGKQIDYRGEEYVKPVEAGDYTDIAGDPAERAIEILAALDVRFDSDRFEPGKVITRQEFYDLWRRLPGGDIHAYYRALGVASESDVVGDDGKVAGGDKALTRQYAALMIATLRGFGDIAELDIYKTGFADSDKISAKYRGGVAIVTGLGYMEPDAQGRFNPEAEMTRSDAALLLIKFI